jgi:NADP-dependent 3-hydroxy acid dehydrogenase YdfG
MRDFKDKVCVISGAGSGIGQALAQQLARRGARLALSDIDTNNVQSTAARCTQLGADAVSYSLDVADRAAVFAHADEVAARFGTVNLVINNAGVAMHQTVLDTSIEDLEWIVAINFWGVVYGTKAFLPKLIDSRDGYLVNISSLFGLIAVPSQAAYNATKFAVRGFSEALRQEMLGAGQPVAVSCVHPGGIKTAIARSARVAASDDKQMLAERFERVARTSPERAARTIIRGIERNQARVLIGADARALDILARTLGSGYQSLVYRAAARAESAAR